MKTKMSKVFSVACLLVCTVVGVQAQNWKYPRVDDGNTIVSRDAAGGIKEAALLTPAEKNWLNSTNTSTTHYNETSPYNKVSAKFKVASTDASTSSTWAEAYTFCKNYSTDGNQGSWRLPTQRELMLMWMFKAKLTSCGNITTASNFFWSGTYQDSGNAWFIEFSSGLTDRHATRMYVRCVRDL